MNKKKKKQVTILAVILLVLIGIIVTVNFIVLPLLGEENILSLFGEDNKITYYFNAYESGEAWTVDPQDMCDGDTGRWARTNQPWQDIPEIAIQHMTANTCDGVDLGTITKVEIRAKVSAPYAPPDINYVTLRPIFNSQDGSDFRITVQGTMWSAWFDITNDVNAPVLWTWDDIVNLDCDVDADVGLSFADCAIVEMQVTYETEAPPPPTHNIAITVLNSETYHGVSGAEVTIDDEMKHTDGMGKVEFNLLEETYIVTMDRYDMVKSTEILTIPYHCPAITFYLNPLEDEGIVDENGDEVPPSTDGTPGFEFMVLIAAMGIAFIYIKKRRRL